MRYREERAAVLAAAQTLERRGLTVGTSGNVSMRVADGVLVTASSIPYSEMLLGDVVLMGFEGGVLEGERPPSVEHKVHLACYQARPDAGAVIHAHPTVATAFAAARRPLPAFLDEFGVYVGAEIRVAEYALSGSDEVAGNVVAALSDDSNACFLASHGIVALGKDLSAALVVTERVERASLTFLAASLLGGAVELPEEARTLFRQVFAYLRSG